MVRYGNYAPPRAMSLNVFEEMRFVEAWRDVAGEHPLGEMWRDVVAAGLLFGLSMSEVAGLIPVVFDGPDEDRPFAVWDRFCARLWDCVDVAPEMAAA